MMITRKPVSLLMSAFIGLFSWVAMANPTTDSTHATTKPAHEAHAVAHDSAHAQAAHAEGEHATAGHEANHGGPVDEKPEVQAFIKHHLLDSHDFNLYADGETGHHVGFPLPVILVDNGLHVFMSSAFHNEKELAEVDGSFYKMVHGVIYKSDVEGTITNDAHGHPTNAKPLDFSITKNVFSLLVTAILIFFAFTSLAKTYKKGNQLPTGFGRILEPLVIYVRDEIARPNIGEKKYKKFMPYLLTVFFLIWTLNLIGLTPLGINVTGNIAVTLCLALCTLVITNVSANADYWKHIFWMPGVPVPMKIVLAPIEVLGIFTKPFSLMIRLFANITAGHSVVMGLIAIIFLFKQQLTAGGAMGVSLALTLFISVIELLVAFLQAFIFTMLSSLFIGMAVQDHHHDDHH
ncbi:MULTISPECIES: F0F1 ATP synthase subunit A [Flavobacterium]|uniref:F0F1 ATP synthase subunit A n=1 Tax=Flavobacterium TaxID=237 RepID=UPI000745DC02|nr:F0F1 ATP synthase subunit A [Flavobacterium covae]AMA48028.1 ATP synthase F0 subunit A [Flavobacterium covae]AND63828.1 ATP synthase F0 subunit A [Flavobacterium covae]MCJ1808835.1 F0F1 ATP synthase subunit A [Flavobacterium covae]